MHIIIKKQIQIILTYITNKIIVDQIKRKCVCVYIICILCIHMTNFQKTRKINEKIDTLITIQLEHSLLVLCPNSV